MNRLTSGSDLTSEHLDALCGGDALRNEVVELVYFDGNDPLSA